MPKKSKADRAKHNRDGFFNVDLAMMWYRADEVRGRNGDGLKPMSLPKFAKQRSKR
jgi:hypothetical protein